jgi:hypothetical protein
MMVAATQLSHCRTRRFSPSIQWMGVVAHILSFVSNGKWSAGAGAGAVAGAGAGVDSISAGSYSKAVENSAPPPTPPPLWTPSVRASFSSTEQLPPSASKDALFRGVEMYRASRLLPTVYSALSSQVSAHRFTRGVGLWLTMLVGLKPG